MIARRLILPVLAIAALVALALFAPAALLGGWRAAFLVIEAVPAGAVVLMLVSRVTGADWSEALLPLARLAPWLLPAFVPVVLDQAIESVAPDHLALWLSPPLFAVRGVALIGFWWWLSRSAARLSPLAAGLALLVHGVAVTIVATDWIMGAAPGQPESAAAMVLTTIQIAAVGAVACLLRLGKEQTRRDLAKLVVAAVLGLAYLLFCDYLIVWYGDLPERVGWYVARQAMPAAILPPAALVIGLPLAIAGAAFPSSLAARLNGPAVLIALLGACLWLVAGSSGWMALAVAAAAATLAATLPIRRLA